MAPLTWVLHAGADHVIRAVQQSQALVIAASDRLARDASDKPRPMGRLWRVHLDLTALVFGEPAAVVDGTYGSVLRLVTLHREFAHRVYEAIDTRESRGATAKPPPTPPTNVIRLVARSGS